MTAPERLEAEPREIERPYLAQAEAVTIAILNGYYRSQATDIRQFSSIAAARLRDFIVLGVEQALSTARAEERERCVQEIARWGTEEPIPSIAAAIRGMT